jgi:hypothetical protein
MPNAVHQDGTAHIGISHSDNDTSIEERKPHRILQNVPPADTQPPEGIPSLQLHAVRFSMDVLEPRYRSQWNRSKASSAESHANTEHKAQEISPNRQPDVMLHDLVPLTDTASSENGIYGSPCLTPLMNRKRNRESTQAPQRKSPSPELHFTCGTESPTTNPSPQVTTHDILAREELEEIQLMVDGAMRLSICGHNKPQGSLKLKANTFVVGLAEVIPVLWRPGYLGVGETSKLMNTMLIYRRH